MKTFKIKLGDFRKLVRESFEEQYQYSVGEMDEADAGPAWSHPWPKPKNSVVLNAHRAVEQYLEPDQMNDMVDGKYLIDPHHPGTVAVRLTDGPAYGNTTVDFIVYNCESGANPDEVEEVQFRSWPPGKSGGYR